MGDLDFFCASTRLSLADLAAKANVDSPAGVDSARVFGLAAALDRAGPGDVAFHFDHAEIEDLVGTRAGACFVTPSARPMVPAHTIALVTDTPLDVFSTLAGAAGFGIAIPPHRLEDGRPSLVSRAARLERAVIVDPGAIVGPEAEIGQGTSIGANSVIGPGVRIGRHCRIDTNVSVRSALIGDRVRIAAGARVGPVMAAVPQLGRVIIQDDVVIGANSVVECGIVGDTLVGEHARIGPLAHVASFSRVDRYGEVASCFSSAPKIV